MIGMNVNCSKFSFTDMMLNHTKTIETRTKNNLKSFVGERIGIIKTGCGVAKLVGFATISEVKVYKTASDFRADENLHRVKAGCQYDFRGLKYGYVLTNIERCRPIQIKGRYYGCRSYRTIPEFILEKCFKKH